MLTDPSYAGQIVIPTYPLVGNYGINDTDVESRCIQVSGFIVRQYCENPSHTDSTTNLDEYLRSNGIPGLSDVDTRAITKKLRTNGVMMGIITSDESPAKALDRFKTLPSYGRVDFVHRVTTNRPYMWNQSLHSDVAGREHLKILVSDCGVKYNILRKLYSRGCKVKVIPSTTRSEDILAEKPDGVILSPGPGNPELLDYLVKTAHGLIGRVPILGICLGNQVIGRAFGGSTYKLKFGHRGANHPVLDIRTGRVHITAQNHGYSLDPDSLPTELKVSHISLNDGTVEGLRHETLPIMSIQYHSEASPGPRDNEYIFDQFIEIVSSAARS